MVEKTELDPGLPLKATGPQAAGVAAPPPPTVIG
jgi:hypothetical protein